MIRRPRRELAAIQLAAFPGSPIASSIASTGPGAPPWRGPFSAPSAATTAETVSESGRRDHARGERGRVHAVVRRGDQVRVERAAARRVAAVRARHAQVVRGVPERRVGRDRSEPRRCAPRPRRTPRLEQP